MFWHPSPEASILLLRQELDNGTEAAQTVTEPPRKAADPVYHWAISETSWQLRSLGFGKVEIAGCMPGEYDRKRKLTLEEFEMLVIARS